MKGLALNFLKLLIRLKFPAIQEITTKEFAHWLLNSRKSQPLVLDARSQTEYAVSHIKTATHIDAITPDLAALSTVAKDRPIVVYCSIGYRSAKLAQQLDKAGMKCIYNLSGGIFQWANEGRLIFKDEHPTQLVHPYNAMWGKLLKATYHAQEQ
ncbi:rhodanese-like domain-containing protein [Nostoc sp. NZL]|uniref:rhodanese-like domain-containing protein n=1 Tax=Nostoc sp. NZL TaxID=2650612 RepID=UPI0018C57B5D|nr:rhodanese-like domain-containing protein [Nostoc sp. NZL]